LLQTASADHTTGRVSNTDHTTAFSPDVLEAVSKEDGCTEISENFVVKIEPQDEFADAEVANIPKYLQSLPLKEVGDINKNRETMTESGHVDSETFLNRDVTRITVDLGNPLIVRHDDDVSCLFCSIAEGC
jgi:hypothetical protein